MTRVVPRLLTILAAALTLAVAGAAPPTIAQNFDAAVDRLKGLPRPGAPLAGRIGYDAYRSEADALAKTYAPGDARFLRSKTAGPDFNTSCLALLTLAVLGDEPDAAAELTGILRDSGFRSSGALMALTYAPAPVALAVADEALARRDAHPEALVIASTLFRFFGEARHASALEAELARRPVQASEDPKNVTADLTALRQRLARPAEERDDWSVQDRVVWRAVRSMSSAQGLDADLQQQAVSACAHTRFTPAYLKDRMGASNVAPLEQRLVLNIASIRPDAALVPDLKRLMASGRGAWAIGVLLAIGTRDALDPVERLITPPKPLPKPPADRGPVRDMSPERFKADARRFFIRDLCQGLARKGDRVTLNLMESLAVDTAYPPQERAAFAQARNALRARLGAGR